MRLYRKEGNTVQILALPSENVEKGEYLLIEDPTSRRRLITQVIDIQFANVPGILEELLRNSTTNELVHEESFDPLEVASHVTYIQDSRLLFCKIRGTIEDGRLSVGSSWLPSRSQSTIKKLPTTSLLTLAKICDGLPIQLGETKELSSFSIDARALDGKLNIVTGKKETGKSHLSKLLVLGLVDYGAPVVVLDLNG
ncbi:MAG: hypothetical protein OEX99_00925, partial [Candidatus Bathyarchaeota archaeon]|nr:hypothetical protein [Candidatus Bathyarchaeota archaeon]